MERSEFRSRVKGFAEFFGKPHFATSDETASNIEYDKAINRANDQFSVVTACLFSYSSEIGVNAGDRLLDFSDPAVCADRLWLATNISIDGNLLRSPDGKHGPCAPHEATTFLLDPNATSPTRWARQSPHSIIFNADFLGTETVKAQGYRKPRPIEPGASGDSLQIDLPDEHAYVAAMYAATLVLEVQSSGTALERLASLDQRAAGQMSAMIEHGQMVLRSVLGTIPTRVDQSEVS